MRGVSILAALVTFLWSASTAGQGIWLRWDDCNSNQVNQAFSGPGVYRQVVTGVGFNEVVRGYRVQLHLTASNVYDSPSQVLPAAWRFDVPSGCQTDQLDVDLVSPPCPSLAGGQAAISVAYNYDGYDLDITLVATFDPVQPERSTHYSLFELTYDHARSVSGPGDPTITCGSADEPVCIVLRDAAWIDANMQLQPVYYERFYGLSWQAETFSCFGDLPLEPSHWTTVKMLYR